jgi:hypothetical protein
MRSLATLLVLPCVLSGLFASGARAQDPPQQEPEQGQALKDKERLAAPTLTMRLGFGATEERAGSGPGRVGQSYNGGLDRQWLFRRGAVNLTGDASKFLYPGASGPSPLTFGGGLSAEYQPTPRARISVSDRLTRGYVRQTPSDLLSSVRLLFPTAITTSNSLGGSFRYDVSPRTQIQGSGNFDHTSFDASSAQGGTTPLDATLLAGSRTVASRFTVQRQVSHPDSLGVVYEFSSSTSSNEQATTQAVRAAWQRTMGKNFGLIVEGGLNIYAIQRLSGVRMAPTGSVTVSRKFMRSALSVRVERLIEVLGSTHVSEAVSPRYTLTIGRNLTVGLEGTYARNTFPVDSNFDYQAWIGSTTVRYALPANLVVSAAYNHWDRVFTHNTAPKTTTSFSSLMLGYVRAWR